MWATKPTMQVMMMMQIHTRVRSGICAVTGSMAGLICRYGGYLNFRWLAGVTDGVGYRSQKFFWLEFFPYLCHMAKQTAFDIYIRKNVSRPGVHAKTKTSVHKKSKNYKKAYRGQGRWHTYQYGRISITFWIFSCSRVIDWGLDKIPSWLQQTII